MRDDPAGLAGLAEDCERLTAEALKEQLTAVTSE